MAVKACRVSPEYIAEIDRVLNDYRNETYQPTACISTQENKPELVKRSVGMNPAWWMTYVIISLYATNAIWLLSLGKPWAAGYWICAAGITVCAMRGLAG